MNPELTPHQEEILVKLCRVFDDVNSLGISFRNSVTITKEFLTITPDFDFDTIDELIKVCNKSIVFQKRLFTSLVYLKLTIERINREKMEKWP